MKWPDIAAMMMVLSNRVNMLKYLKKSINML